MYTEPVEIDGSEQEGGGQILRIALSLSALRQIPIRVTKIRAGRSKPGLMEQHLKGIELIKDLCGAKVKGVSNCSTEIVFWPGPIKEGYFRAYVKTAGSISLLLQVILPCALFANGPTKFLLQGGTNAEMAPQFDYTTEIFKPILEKFGATFDFKLIKRGYFPRGGGEVIININPVKKLNPVILTERGNITAIYGWSFVAGTLPQRLAYQMADSAMEILKEFKNVSIERYKENKMMASDNCSGIILVAETDKKCILGSSALCGRLEKVEDTGKRAAEQLVKILNEGACVDDHCQDQLIIFMALAKGQSQIKVGNITTHTKTAISVVERFTEVKFEIIPAGSCNIIKCSGSKEEEKEADVASDSSEVMECAESNEENALTDSSDVKFESISAGSGNRIQCLGSKEEKADVTTDSSEIMQCSETDKRSAVTTGLTDEIQSSETKKK